MEMIIIAIILGLSNGFHCLGMCGPIAFTLGLNFKNKLDYCFKNLSYQIGRVITYVFLGGILGLIGQLFTISNMQNQLSILVGILLLIVVIIPKILLKFLHFSFINKILLEIKLKLSKLIIKKSFLSKFLTGLLNGFLPCGIVYIALTSSLAFNSILNSMIFMMFFGIGTIPMMFLAVYFGNIINIKFRNVLFKFYPLIIIVLASMFILRGMEVKLPHIFSHKTHLKIQPINKYCK